MKVLVLGASGFLGRNITTNLRKSGYDVTPICRNDVDLSDFTEVFNLLHKYKVDNVINCTIPSGRDRINNISQEDFDEHFRIFLNFYNLSQLFQKFISIGSGAEFDRECDIFNANESDILSAVPIDLYGKLKNTIARISSQHPKFYNLRMFGCFDKSENDSRFFKKLSNGGDIIIQDKYFDFISVDDFCIVLDYCLNNDVMYKDINCVYTLKTTLTQIAAMFKEIHKTPINIIVESTKNLNYTGNGGRLDSMKLPLKGLINSIKDYNE